MASAMTAWNVSVVSYGISSKLDASTIPNIDSDTMIPLDRCLLALIDFIIKVLNGTAEAAPLLLLLAQSLAHKLGQIVAVRVVTVLLKAWHAVELLFEQIVDLIMVVGERVAGTSFNFYFQTLTYHRLCDDKSFLANLVRLSHSIIFSGLIIKIIIKKYSFLLCV